MKNVEIFEMFVKKGIVKKQAVDKSRANDLIEEAMKSYEVLTKFVNKLGIEDISANHVIKNSYDVLMEFIRAKMFLEGFNSSGYGAHEAEVSYLRRLNFSEKEVLFANQLRYYRNSINYYGKKFDKDYAEKVFKFLSKIIGKLK